MIKKLSKKGFTLTELMVVVLILGILATFAIPQYLTTLEIAKAREAIDFARQWQNARDIYYSENGDFPRNNSFEALGLDENVLDFTQVKVLRYFDLYTNVSNTIYFIRKSNNLYMIYATDDDLFCCWNPSDTNNATKAQKICQNLVSSNEPPVTNPPFNTHHTSCYALGDSD